MHKTSSVQFFLCSACANNCTSVSTLRDWGNKLATQGYTNPIWMSGRLTHEESTTLEIYFVDVCHQELTATYQELIATAGKYKQPPAINSKPPRINQPSKNSQQATNSSQQPFWEFITHNQKLMATLQESTATHWE